MRSRWTNYHSILLGFLILTILLYSIICLVDQSVEVSELIALINIKNDSTLSLENIIENHCIQKKYEFEYCLILFKQILDKVITDESSTFDISDDSKVFQSNDAKRSERLSIFRHMLSRNYRHSTTKSTLNDADSLLENKFDGIIWNTYINTLLNTYKQRDTLHSTTRLKNHRIMFIHSCSMPPSSSPHSSTSTTTTTPTTPPSSIPILLELIDSALTSGLYTDLTLTYVLNYGVDIFDPTLSVRYPITYTPICPSHSSSLSEEVIILTFYDYLQYLNEYYPKIVFIQRSVDVSHYEVPTLRHIHTFSRHIQALVAPSSSDTSINSTDSNNTDMTCDIHKSSAFSSDNSNASSTSSSSSTNSICNSSSVNDDQHISDKESILKQYISTTPSYSSAIYNTQILYIHTKGISYTYSTQSSTGHKYDSSIDYWRYMMTYYLIILHRQCYHILTSGVYDTIGCNYAIYPTNTHYYSGKQCIYCTL